MLRALEKSFPHLIPFNRCNNPSRLVALLTPISQMRTTEVQIGESAAQDHTSSTMLRLEPRSERLQILPTRTHPHRLLQPAVLSPQVQKRHANRPPPLPSRKVPDHQQLRAADPGDPEVRLWATVPGPNPPEARSSAFPGSRVLSVQHLQTCLGAH